jgi:hypothetical protein
MKTVRIMEIADILGVIHQSASSIADEPGDFPIRSDARARAVCGIGARSRRGRSGGGRKSRGPEPVALPLLDVCVRSGFFEISPKRFSLGTR